MGKNVLIIGASGDIGIAVATRLAHEGYQLLLHYNKNKDHIKKSTHLFDHESVIAYIQADLTKDADVNRFLDELVMRVDYIVFASGVAQHGLFQEATDDMMDEMISLHVKSPLIITRHLLPKMIQRKAGKIILITSIWGDIGASHEVIYSAVKGAQNSFVKALAKEVAPSGITVNAISPGFIDTKMNAHLNEIEKEAIISDIPMNRAGIPSEIAHTVSFLFDEQSSYIQGEVIHMTGGW